MFTGIIEELTILEKTESKGDNIDFTFKNPFKEDIKVDQSIAHNGVCLTVIAIFDESYTVTAVDETLKRTNLGKIKIGDAINLERCMKVGGRLDGHIVQGHVDNTATCKEIIELDGSTELVFQFNEQFDKPHWMVEKGSICINGISLTVVQCELSSFSVVVIPYTIEHTNLKSIKVGSSVNIEFDILGKYIERMHSTRQFD